MFEVFQFLGLGKFNDKVCSLTSEYTDVQEKIKNLSTEEYNEIQKKVDEIKKADFTSLVVLTLSLSGSSVVRISGFETSKVYFLKI